MLLVFVILTIAFNIFKALSSLTKYLVSPPMNSEEEFWDDDSQMEELVMASASATSSPERTVSTGTFRGRHDETKSSAVRDKYVEIGVGTDITERASSKHASRSTQLKPLKPLKLDGRVSGRKLPTPFPIPAPIDQSIRNDSMEEDEDEVLRMVDTESESSQAPTRASSFSFADSRTTSLTSLESSSASLSSRSSPQKRTRLYPDLPSPLQRYPSPKMRRTVDDLPNGAHARPSRSINKTKSAGSIVSAQPTDVQDIFRTPGHASPTRVVTKRTENVSASLASPQPTDIFSPSEYASPISNSKQRKEKSFGSFSFPQPTDVTDVSSAPGQISPSHTHTKRTVCSSIKSSRSFPFPPTADAPDAFRTPRHASPTRTSTKTTESSPTKSSSMTVFVQGSSKGGTEEREVPRRDKYIEQAQPVRAKGNVPAPSREIQETVDSQPELRHLIEKIYAPKELALDTVIVAHSAQIQKCMEGLSWGVQYEIARGVSCRQWTWADVTSDKLKQLSGRNADSAHRVSAIMRGLAVPEKRPSSIALWQELDREQDAICENRNRGIGLMGEWGGQPNWYGGKIQQMARLRKAEPDEKGSSYIMYLERMEMRRSNRFARFLGSRRLLSLHIPKKLLRDGEPIFKFLRSKFVICGRVFMPLHAKDGKLYLIETAEDYERTASSREGDRCRLTLDQIIEWYNPFALNAKQAISKWSTRWALGLSTSVPVLEFDPENINFIDDEFGHGVQNGKAPTEQVMTDGCGFMNAAALMGIAKQMGYRSRPTAVQGRVAGSKGLWILHPEPQHQQPDGLPKIWIRASQKKISLGDDLAGVHRAHLVFDLLGPDRLTFPARLSMQTVLNLSHNGVPNDVFESLMVHGLQEDVAKLTKWDGPNAMVLLLDAVDKAGRVTGAKLQRLAGSMSRALGFSGREFNKNKGEDEDNFFDASDDAPDPPEFDHSLAPVSAHEEAVELIKAGFQPLRLSFLYEKLKHITALKIQKSIKDFHITIPQSAEVFIIPDPLDVLKEGEVYFRSSTGFEDMYSDTVEGPVLISRNPTRVASDVRKVQAVKRPELADYCNVLVVSIKGSRSMASFLGGGDYDGDTVMIVWDPRIVEPFCNSSLRLPASDFLEQNFNPIVEKVPDFLRRISDLPHSEAQSELQKILLQGLADRKVGVYSTYHDIAVHAFGLEDERTERLAHMFTHCLDSDKTGLRVKMEVQRKDRLEYDREIPPCMKETEEHLDDEQAYVKVPLKRVEHLRPCVLCGLVLAGDKEKDKHLEAYKALEAHLDMRTDKDVLSALENASQRAKLRNDVAPVLAAELKRIEAHVQGALEAWIAVWSIHSSPSKSDRSPKKKLGKKGNSKMTASKTKQDMLRDVVKQYVDGPPADSFMVVSLHDLKSIKAGYAYQKNPKFAFSVAFWDVCGCKADAKGRSTATEVVASLSNIPSSILRVLQASADD